jgi:hypothetical protein
MKKLCCLPLFADVFSSHEFLFSLLLYSAGDIGGCLFGIAIMQTRKSIFQR